jgi:type IV pilus assembly protein PilC
MPLFTYKAIRKGESEPYENTVEAKDRFEIYAIVRKEDAQVLSVKEGSAHKAMFENLLSGLSRVSEGDKIILMRNLGSMITAGLALSRALNVMERQTKNAKLKEVLQSIGQDIQQGNALNVAMTKHPKVFTPLMIAMVKSGEESGSLAESCQIIADQNERVYELKKKVRGAMIYPSVILFVLLSIGTLMMLYIVPTLSKTFEDMGSELPLSTQVIIKLSNFLVDYTALTLLACVGIVAVFITFIRTSFGKHAFESVVLRIPVIGTLVKETNSARTGRTLSSLLSSGVHVLHALEITQEVIQNLHYKKVIKKSLEQVQKGAPMADVFINEEKLYPPLVGELIAVGEETGNLPDMLRQVAVFYEKEVDQKTKNMSTIVEPILMLVVGAAVGYFALAMISPIYSVMENM